MDFLLPDELHIRCRMIIGTHKGTTILTIPHMSNPGIRATLSSVALWPSQWYVNSLKSPRFTWIQAVASISANMQQQALAHFDKLLQGAEGSFLPKLQAPVYGSF